jgi:two-component system nitrogen regulation response regulator GlnG
METTMPKRLLILDDDPDILDALNGYFADGDMELMLETDSEAALERIKSDPPHVAVLDINLPKKSGLEVLKEIRRLYPRLPVIMTTGYRTTQNAIEAMKQGAYDYLTKPYKLNNLAEVVDKAYQSSLLSRGVRYTREAVPANMDEQEADVMIGSSPEMIEIWKMVGKIADSDDTVLIQGENGTGKELLARAIYLSSKRKNRPFLAVNCAAMPENLLESELFGHEKGAFTDAVSRRVGKFEQCNGGTIFLDEIGEMSQAKQGKLLRVLETQEFERVGGNETIKVDVRIITATNRSLIEAVREKEFRMDLFYRLRVISFFLPPLRERVEDIPLLTDFFIKRYFAKNGITPKEISPKVMELLTSHPWRGNIRELKNVVNSAIVFSKSDTLLPEDFLPHLQASATLMPSESDGPGDDCYAALKPLFERITYSNPGVVYETFIAEAETALFRMVIEKCNNNQVQASRFLGISRNMLRARLKQLKIS